MPALTFVALALSLGLGLGISRFAARAPGAALLAVGALGVLVTGPGAGYVVLAYPDWSFGYRFASALGEIPILFSVIAVLGAAAGPSAGFAAAQRMSAGPSRARLPLALAATLALGVTLGIAPHRAPFRHGTTAQVRGGFRTPNLLRTDLGLTLVWIAAFAATGTWLVRRELERDETAPAAPKQDRKPGRLGRARRAG